MTDSSKHPHHVHGTGQSDPKWIPARDLNNDGADLMGRGEIDEAERMLREAIALTSGSDEANARDIHARALLNLSGVHDFRAELGEALRIVDEALMIAQRLVDEIGDVRGTRTVIVNGMVSRTQILVQSDRMDDAFAQTDEALALLDAYDVHQDALMRFQVHNARASLLLFAGRLQDAETEARRALDLSAIVDPRLAAHPYLTLAAVARHTGDSAASYEFIELADALSDNEDTDAVTRQITLENRARAAMQQERFDEAGDLFRQAARLAKEGGLATRLTASKMGVAAAYLQTGNPVLAAKVLRQLIAELGTEGAVHDRREAYSYLGDAESRRGKFVLADEAYRASRALARSPYELCRTDLRRAEMHAEWASFTPLPRKRAERLRTALDMTIPVLLATEALRNSFTPGPVRERWSLEVTAPARELAFTLMIFISDYSVSLEMLENATASATLQAESVEAVHASAPDDERLAPVTPLFGDDPDPDVGAESVELPAAAAGFVGDMGSSSAVRFAPPPRVMAAPGQEPALEKWIRVAEAQYGVAVRSDVVVAGW